MGQINDILTKQMTPKMAIIVFHDNDNEYYLEQRPIKKGKMGAGVPLSQECINNVVDSLSSDCADIIHGAIPSNMLFADCRVGHEKYVWYQRPTKKHVFFKDELNIPNGEMCVPGLVYVVKNNSLSLFSYKGIMPKGKLLRAPFFNIYSNNTVCLGNAKVKKASILTYESIIRYWEEMFWKSEFSHLIGGNVVKNNLSSLTKRLIETGEKFPGNELIPIKTKLKDLL